MSDFNINFNGTNYNDNNVPNEIKLSGKDDVLSIFDRNKDGKLSKKELKDAILSFLQEEKNVSAKFSDSKISDQEATEIAKHFKNGYYKIGENIQKLIKELQSRITSSRDNIIGEKYNSGININSIKKGDMRNVLPSNSDLFIDCGDNQLYILDDKKEYKPLGVTLGHLLNNGIRAGKSDIIIEKDGKCYFATIDERGLIVKDQDGKVVQCEFVQNYLREELYDICRMKEQKERLFKEYMKEPIRIDYSGLEHFEAHPPQKYKAQLEDINEYINRAKNKLMSGISEDIDRQYEYDAYKAAQEKEERNKTSEKTEPVKKSDNVISIKKINSSGQSEKAFWNDNGRRSIQALNYKKQAYAKAGFQAKVLGLTKEVSEKYHKSAQGLSRFLDKLTGQYEEITYYTRTNEKGHKEYYIWDEASHSFYLEKEV